MWVHGWDVPAASASFTLYQWLLGTEAAGNMIVSASIGYVLQATSNNYGVLLAVCGFA